MKRIKALLLQLLGQSKYLQLTSKVFFFAFRNEWLRNNPAYDTHYFVRHFIKRGDTIIDIGANLGYYSVEFAKRVGRSGKVYSVEPIELYRSVLKNNVGGLPQVEILPYALGDTEGVIKMGNPSSDKHRHGLMRVLKDSEQDAGQKTYTVPIKNPANLFCDLSMVNYIKCDVEGYEIPVIPAMEPIIRRHQPILQIETDGDNKMILFSLLSSLDYGMYYIKGDRLIAYTNPEDLLPADLIGIPKSQSISYKHLFS